MASAQPRETVLDRKAQIERELLEVPSVPPLCEQADTTKKRVNVGDAELYCEVEGEGTPVVLLHGGPGATHHYFHPHFARARSSAKVIYYDQRGCGQSDHNKPGTPYSVGQSVDDLENLRKALGLERWVVLGHSYGGLVAQAYTVQYPERVAGLLLVGATAATRLKLNPTRQYDFLSKEEMLRIREIYRHKELPLPKAVFNAHLNGDWKRQSFYRPSKEQLARMALYEWKHDGGVRAINTQAIDLGGAFAQCSVPTLILEGRWDLTWNTDKPEKLHQEHPNARLVMFERSGHSPFADEPDRFSDVLTDFISKLPEVSDAHLASWKAYLVQWKQEQEKSAAHIVRQAQSARKADYQKLAQAYSREWLEKLDNSAELLHTGFALYDGKRYEEALDVFRKLHERVKGDKSLEAVALIWQGFMLDLLGRREEAIGIYTKVKDASISSPWTFSQFGLEFAPSPYAAERMEKPFTRVENTYE